MRMIGILLGLLLFFQPLYADTLKLLSKDFVFEVNSDTGGMIFRNLSPKSSMYRNFLFEDTPPTSYPSLIIGDEAYHLDDPALNVEQDFTLKGNQISGIWDYEGFRFRVLYALTNLGGYQNDSVVVSIKVDRFKDSDKSVGVRLLFDTTIGEAEGFPLLYLSSTEKVAYEREFDEVSLPKFIYSGDYKIAAQEFKNGFYLYPRNSELVPKKLIIGNWKHLTETDIDYQIQPKDKFKYSRYSNHDAAVAVIFSDIDIRRGQSLSFGSILSLHKLKKVQIIKAVKKQVPEIVSNTNQQKKIEPLRITNRAKTNQLSIDKKDQANTNAVATFSNTNLRNSATSNLIRTNKLLNSQLKVLEKLSALIERLDARLNPISNQSLALTNKVILTVTNQLSFSTNQKILVVTNTIIKTLTNVQEVYVGESNQNELLKEQEERYRKEIEKLKKENKKAQELQEEHFRNLMKTQQAYVNQLRESQTNTKSVLENEQKKMDNLKKQYDASLESQKIYYQELLKKEMNLYQDKELALENDLKKYKEKKQRSDHLEGLDRHLTEIDQLIEVIEKMEALKLTGENLSLDEIKKMSREVDKYQSYLQEK